MTTTATAIQFRESAEYALKTATRMLKATDKWLNWCDGLHQAKIAANLYTEGGDNLYKTDRAGWTTLSISVERTYMAAHKRPSMPSKNHKHRMYSEVYRLASLTGVDTSAGIRDLDGIREVLARATAAPAA